MYLISLVINLDNFSPKVIRREMKSILDLFEEKNFANISINEDSKGSLLFNATKIKQWMEPMMSNYCVIFELNCDRTGCGIDDNCTAEQWCIDEEKGYQCSPKSMYLCNFGYHVIWAKW